MAAAGRPGPAAAGTDAVPSRTDRASGGGLGADKGAAPQGGGPGGLPRRVRQASLAPQLKREQRRTADRAETADRDADEVRSRMASLQRGWQRGREENAAGDQTHSGPAPQGTNKGDGR
jgi:hypothetical protein